MVTLLVFESVETGVAEPVVVMVDPLESLGKAGVDTDAVAEPDDVAASDADGDAENAADMVIVNELV